MGLRRTKQRHSPQRTPPGAPRTRARLMLALIVAVVGLGTLSSSIRGLAQDAPPPAPNPAPKPAPADPASPAPSPTAAPQPPTAPATPAADHPAAPAAEPAIADRDAFSIELLGSDEVDAVIDVFKTESGQIALVLAGPLHLSYPVAGFDLRAGSAVLWATPENRKAADDIAAAPADQKLASALKLLSRINSLEVFAEDNVRASYGQPGTASVVRCDSLYLTIVKGELDDATGRPAFTLRGVMDNARAHTAEANPGEKGAASLLQKREDSPGSASAASEATAARRGTSTADPTARPGATTVDAAAAAAEAAAQRHEADVFALEKGRRLFVRAAHMRVLAATTPSPGNPGVTDVEIEHGEITTSALSVPNYSFHADAMRILLRGTRNTIDLKHPALNIRGGEALTWPADGYMYDLDSRFPVTRLDLSNSDAFGTNIRTKMDIITGYDFFFDPEPPFRPFKFSPIFDWFDRRGVGSGAEFEVSDIKPFDTGASAWLQGYGIHDRGDDRPVARTLGFYPLRNTNRGRFRGYARLRTESGFQADTNINYQSDGHFLEEFYRGEFLSNEQTQSFFRVRRDLGPRSFYAEATVRGRDFVDEVEHLPVFGFSTFRESVGARSLGLQMSTDATAGLYRLHLKDSKNTLDQRQILRGDFSARINRPLDFGLFTLDPYLGARATFADTGFAGNPAANPLYDPFAGFTAPPTGSNFESNAVTRAQLLFGASAQTTASRTLTGTRSEFLDLRGLRHLVTPQVRWENVAGSTGRSRRFLQMDEVDAADSRQQVTLSLRNRLQTRRPMGNSGTESTVDWIDFLIESPFFPNSERDNKGTRFGDTEARLIFNPSRYVAFSGGAFFEPQHLNWTRLFGSAAMNIGETEWTVYARSMRGLHEVIGASLDANLSDTYRIRIGQEYDLGLDRFRDTFIRISRSVVEAVAINAAIRRDAISRDLSISFSLSALFGPGGN